MSSGRHTSRERPPHRPAMTHRLACSVLRVIGFPLIAVAGCAFITALRVSPILIHPALGWDERIIFSAFYSGKGGIFYLYPDYISVLQNAIFVFAFNLFSLSHIPAVLCYTAFTINTCALALFSLPVFRGIIRSDVARTATCLLLAALPLGNAAIATAPAYQNWTCLAVNCLVSSAWLASYRSRLWQIPYLLVFVLAICILSQPLSICLGSVYALVALMAKWVDDRRTRNVASLLLALTIISAGEAFTLGRGAAHAGTVSYDHLLASVVRAIPFALDRGLLEGFIGAHWRGVLIKIFPPVAPGMAPLALYLVAAVTFACLLSASWLTQKPELRAFVAANLFTNFCLALFILPALELARPGFSSGMLIGLSRYWFAQHVVIMIVFCALVWCGISRGSNVLVSISSAEDGSSVSCAKLARSWSAGRCARASMTVTLLALWLALSNTEQLAQYSGGASTDSWVKMASRQKAFLRWVSTQEASGATGCLEQGPEEPEPRVRLVLRKERDLATNSCQVFLP